MCHLHRWSSPTALTPQARARLGGTSTPREPAHKAVLWQWYLWPSRSQVPGSKAIFPSHVWRYFASLHCHRNCEAAMKPCMLALSGIFLHHQFSHQGLLLGRSHRSDWSGFNPTTFRGNNHISANIHGFGGARSRLVGSHVATVDRASSKVTLPSLRLTQKWRWNFSYALCSKWSALRATTHLCAAAFGSVTPYCNRTTSNRMAMALTAIHIVLRATTGVTICDPPNSVRDHVTPLLKLPVTQWPLQKFAMTVQHFCSLQGNTVSHTNIHCKQGQSPVAALSTVLIGVTTLVVYPDSHVRV